MWKMTETYVTVCMRRGFADVKKRFQWILIIAATVMCIGAGAAAEDEMVTPPVKIINYRDHIEPILKRSCYECHGENKQKGKLRLDSPAAIRSGGRDGAIIRGKDPLRSALYQLCALDPDNEDIMPSKGDSLTAEELLFLKLWIEQGSLFPDGQSAGGVSENVPLNELDRLSLTLPAVSEAEEQAIEALRASGVSIEMLGKEQTLCAVNCSHVATINQEHLRCIVARIVWADCAAPVCDDALLACFAQAPHLRRLHLEKSVVTNEGFQQLSRCLELEYLNISETQLGDAIVPTIARLPALQDVYYHDTQLTRMGVMELRIALHER